MKEHAYLIGITAAGVALGMIAYKLADHYVLKPHVFGTATK